MGFRGETTASMKETHNFEALFVCPCEEHNQGGKDHRGEGSNGGNPKEFLLPLTLQQENKALNLSHSLD